MSYQIHRQQIVSTKGRWIRDESRVPDYYAVVESVNEDDGGYIELRLASWNDKDDPSVFLTMPRDDSDADSEFAGQVEVSLADIRTASEELRAFKRGEHPLQAQDVAQRSVPVREPRP
jgi:hypothetical protein